MIFCSPISIYVFIFIAKIIYRLWKNNFEKYPYPLLFVVTLTTYNAHLDAYTHKSSHFLCMQREDYCDKFPRYFRSSITWKSGTTPFPLSYVEGRSINVIPIAPFTPLYPLFFKLNTKFTVLYNRQFNEIPPSFSWPRNTSITTSYNYSYNLKNLAFKTQTPTALSPIVSFYSLCYFLKTSLLISLVFAFFFFLHFLLRTHPLTYFVSHLFS